MSRLNRCAVLRLCGWFLGVTLTLLAQQAEAQTKDPVYIGITGPLTGQYAQYGAQWKKGFDYALDEINAAGGINGRPLQYIFEDSQSDPRQTVVIARKFVGGRARRGGGRGFLQCRLDGGFADLSGSGPRAVRLHQFPPGFHQGRRLHLEQRRQPEGRDAAARGSRPRHGAEAARRPLHQQRLGPHRQGPARRGRQEARRRGGRRGGLSGRREGFPLRHRAACAMRTRIGIALISYYPDGAQLTRQIHNAGHDAADHRRRLDLFAEVPRARRGCRSTA